MKERILKFFKEDRSYRGTVTLYQEIGTRLSLKKQINVQQESDYLKGVIFHEFKQMAGLSDQEFKDILLVPVSAGVKKSDQPVKQAPVVVKKTNKKPAGKKTGKKTATKAEAKKKTGEKAVKAVQPKSEAKKTEKKAAPKADPENVPAEKSPEPKK